MTKNDAIIHARFRHSSACSLDWPVRVLAQSVVGRPGLSARRRAPAIRRELWAARIDEKARKLGAQGEEFVVEYEQRRLHDAGRPDLVDKIVRVSQDVGDWLGYDVRSFEPNGDEIHIEVKTTNRGIYTPFCISVNEVDHSEQAGKAYRLYRLFNFSQCPRMYKRGGPIRDHFVLAEKDYLASPNR